MYREKIEKEVNIKFPELIAAAIGTYYLIRIGALSIMYTLHFNKKKLTLLPPSSVAKLFPYIYRDFFV